MHPAAMRSGEKLLKYVDDGRDRTTAGLPGYSPVGESSHFSVADVVLPLLDLFHDAVLKLCFTISTAAYSCTINLSFLSSLRPLGINLKTFLAFNETMAFSLSDCHL